MFRGLFFVASEGQMSNFFLEDLERLLNIPMNPRLFRQTEVETAIMMSNSYDRRKLYYLFLEIANGINKRI